MMKSIALGIAFAALGVAACSRSSNNAATASADGGSPGGASGGQGGASGGAGKGNGGKTGGSPPGLPMVPGQPDTAVQTALPALPAMVNVEGVAIDDNVDITFDPIDGAVDYRVYALPKDSDVSSDGQGHVTVKNALYRCAGNRQMPQIPEDAENPPANGGTWSYVDGKDVHGYTRKLADATLGYVYTTPGTGRVPVYAMGDPGLRGDADCGFMRFGSTRVKKYVTADADRTALLAQKWRDDGVVFYVPDQAGADTKPVYMEDDDGDDGYRVYFVDGPEADVRKSKNVAFQALTAAGGADTKALMRVYYDNICGRGHDELVPGKAWFERVRRQGDQNPMFDLHWAGLDGDTTLVVEALGDGCPYPGFLAPKSEPAGTGGFDRKVPQWQTLDELRAASPTGEVYVNGQFDTTASPRPIARSFLKISPGPAPSLDWFEGFGASTTLGALTDTPCGVDNCFAQHRLTSPLGDFAFMAVDDHRYGVTKMLGEMWVTYDDLGADVNGKFRFTPPKKATMSADTFLYSTMTVDSFTTGRRYPQILISDQDVPVQNNMASGNTIVIETFMNWPNSYQVEVCDHKAWDVNAQCPGFDSFHVLDAADPTKVIGLSPGADVGEHVGVDRSTIFDVYASTKRVYLFLDQQPYGCVDLPAAGVPTGPVTVTYGDVLYHSDVDITFDFHTRHLQVETRRHYDNLGFKSAVPEPDWDFNRFPCASHMKDF